MLVQYLKAGVIKPDAIILKINNKLVKIESYKSEYFFLYFLITKIRNSSEYRVSRSKLTFKASNISVLLKNFSESVVRRDIAKIEITSAHYLPVTKYTVTILIINNYFLE